MHPMSKSSSIKFGGKAIYEICVEGELDPSLQDSFSQTKIQKVQLEDYRTVSVLTGLIQDEAELMGVLSILFDLHKVILSVKRLSANSGNAGKNSIADNSDHAKT
jgi:hypothetical protein